MKQIMIAERVPLAPMTTLGLGGAARYFVAADDTSDCVEALRFAAENQLPVAVLGGGSNLVVADQGFDGIVLQPALRGVSLSRGGGVVSAEVAAGESWDDFVGLSVSKDLAGIECLAGIPGTVGATPIQNVGAYGVEVAEVITSVRTLDRETHTERVFANRDCEFAYRSSRFRRQPDRFVVLAVTFELTLSGNPCVRYPELQRKLESSRGRQPDLAKVRQAVLELRQNKGMRAGQGGPNQHSVGSFFVNPTLDAASLAALTDAALTCGAVSTPDEIPQHRMDDDATKIPAAWLIGAVGFAKGFRRGAVGLSSQHLLALVHHKGGTASELLRLAGEIRHAVEARLGVRLEPEPVFLGFSQDELEAVGLG